jgi:hypothetical protein
MRTRAIHAGRAPLATALTARMFGTRGGSKSAEAYAGLLPFIGAGTFLVAAYLGTNLCLNLLTDNLRSGPPLGRRATRLR